MLRQLHISGLGVIDDLDLELHPGLNVLTGETGAGKTMVTIGLSLALGGRASAHFVRDGAAALRVQALFDAPPGLDEWAEDGELLLGRHLARDGKSTARIGGQLATASSLAQLGAGLVEVHGQHQTLSLLRPGIQTAFLDRFAGDAHIVALAAFRSSFEQLRSASASLDELSIAARDREREIDLLAYQVREIEAAAPQPGESENLDTEAARLGHVERLLELAALGEAALAGETGAAELLAQAGQAAETAAGLDPEASGLADRAAGLVAEAAELAHDLRGYREGLAADPGRLDQIRERIADLRGLQRKYGDTDADVIAFGAAASERLAGLVGADERLVELRERVTTLTAEAAGRGEAVTAGRREAAPRLASLITAELEQLGMPGAGVEVALEPATSLEATGAEHVELRFTPGGALSPAPLTKVASGGELSRVMLACRSVLADLDEVPTLVFDEVDTGIGGEAGRAVGRRLAALAGDRQVLVVTHLPQIACFADRHVRVRKDDGAATVEVVEGEDRVQEISRMLAGMESSEHALSHAHELLADAAQTRGATRTRRGARADVPVA